MYRNGGYTPLDNKRVLRWKVERNNYYSTSYNLIAG
jgi:hypothetical protein